MRINGNDRRIPECVIVKFRRVSLEINISAEITQGVFTDPGQSCRYRQFLKLFALPERVCADIGYLLRNGE